MESRRPFSPSDSAPPDKAKQEKKRQLVSSSERKRRRQRLAEARQEALHSLSRSTARAGPSAEEWLPSPERTFYHGQGVGILNGRDGSGRSLVIACGALAKELVEIKKINHCEHLDITCLPAIWHNHPERIPQAVQHKITTAKQQNYRSIFVAYGDCGTGGELDRILKKESVERLGGAHCYAFFTGLEAFDEIQEQEPGTFYLTDYLLRHFDRLVLEPLKIKDRPEMRDLYFGNYKKLLYLAQGKNPEMEKMAQKAAEALGLEYHYRLTAFGALNEIALW